RMSDTHEERAQAEAGATTPMAPVAPPGEQATEVAEPPGPSPESEAASPPDEEEPSAEPEEPSDDPFASWPQPESAEVIEDVPEEGESVQHVAGEIDVPDGYAVLEGTPSGHRRSVAVVVSRFNGSLTNRMLAVAIETLEEAGVSSEAVTIMP